MSEGGMKMEPTTETWGSTEVAERGNGRPANNPVEGTKLTDGARSQERGVGTTLRMYAPEKTARSVAFSLLAAAGVHGLLCRACGTVPLCCATPPGSSSTYSKQKFRAIVGSGTT